MTDRNDDSFCVYLYTNKINNKKYVGKTNDVKIRDRQHVYASENYSYPQITPFELALKKHGRDNFTLEILKENLTEDEAFKFEAIYIEKFETFIDYGKGYNANTGGNGGHSLSELSKQKHSDAMKKAWKENDNLNSDERNKKISDKVSKYLRENPDKHTSKKTRNQVKKITKINAIKSNEKSGDCQKIHWRE